MRIGFIFGSLMWLAFQFSIQCYTGAVCEIITISTFVGSYFKYKKKE